METEEAEAFIPIDSVINITGGRNVSMLSNNVNITTTLRRKAAKRTEPWYLESPPPAPPPPPPQLRVVPARRSGVRRSTRQMGLQFPRHLAAPQPQPQDGDQVIPVTKKPRLETPPTATAIAEDPDTQSNTHPVAAGRATGRWTREEDAELTSAVANTRKKKRGKEYKRDWVTIAELVPGRTKNQCFKRWQNILDPSIYTQSNNHPRATDEATPRWTPEEDTDLSSAVANACKKKYGKEYRTDWADVAALIPGRTKNQCLVRWHVTLKLNVDRTAGRAGAWTEDEDIKLRHAVQIHVDNDYKRDWVAIATLVPGRTKTQCLKRWHDFLKHGIDRATGGRSAMWAEGEDSKLKDAVHIHGGRDWVAITALVPGRTKDQCLKRWHNSLSDSIDRTARRAVAWTKNEDGKLKNSVQLHGGKDWVAIATLVPGRTKKQCRNRWHNALTPSIALTAGRTGSWTEGEDRKLRHAVQMHGGKDWGAITALVPGRTKNQCRDRWYCNLFPISVTATGRTDGCTEDEDGMLQDAV